MPFINALKRRLDAGETPDAVLNRQLPFDELATLQEMVSGLKQTVTKCVAVEVVSIAEGGKTGVSIKQDGSKGEERGDLPPQALSAEPGSPTFSFENVDGIPVR